MIILAQKEILDFMFKVKRPITKKELNWLNISRVSRDRSLSKLVKFKMIDCKHNKTKPSLYWLK